MGQTGFIHDKLDIKFLVLYLMARVASPVDFAVNNSVMRIRVFLSLCAALSAAVCAADRKEGSASNFLHQSLDFADMD